MNRRTFFKLSAASLAAAALPKIVACEGRKVRLWLGEIRGHDTEPFCVVARGATTYRDVAAERIVPAIKIGERLDETTAHRAVALEPGDGLFKKRVINGDLFDPPSQLWVVCRVEALS